MWFHDVLIIASGAFVDFLLRYVLRLHPPFSCMSLLNFSLHYVSTPDPCWIWVVGGYLSLMCPSACARWYLMFPVSCQSFRRLCHLLLCLRLFFDFLESLFGNVCPGSGFWILPACGYRFEDCCRKTEIIPNCELFCLLVGASLQKS